MFDIGWSEMAVILVVALIVIGPKDLPRVARTVGRWAGKGRAMAREFQTALEDMAREAELDKVKAEIEKAGRTNVGKTIEKTIDPSGDLSKAFDPNSGVADKAAAGAKPNSNAAAASSVKALDGPEAGKADAPEAGKAADQPAAKSTPAKPAVAKPAVAKPAPIKPASGRPAASTKSAAAKSSEDGERPKAAPPSERSEHARETAPAEPS